MPKKRRSRPQGSGQSLLGQGAHRQSRAAPRAAPRTSITSSRRRVSTRGERRRSASTSAIATTSISFPTTTGSRPSSRSTSSTMGWSDLNWLEDVHLGYEEGRAAVFDRNVNGWVTVPEKRQAAGQSAGPRHAGARATDQVPDVAAPPDGRSQQGLPQVLIAAIARNRSDSARMGQSGRNERISTPAGMLGLNIRLCQ